MSSSMCPHLVQEYFERVSEILVTYRPQILKQVEYDKISENLVLRGAVRQEEHERIDRCDDPEGKVSQMLVVVQNRMWGLENLLAAFMEEHVSSWLTQEMFRAYMEHLVNPLKKLQDSPPCHCVLMSNSMLYRGWVKALKSLDTMILKAGNSLGFMKQTMFPADNMLTFLSEKLAQCTGGDSLSARDELVPYGFAPNASGEVQVAELEEDDFNDLITLGETLSIAYPMYEPDPDMQGGEDEKPLDALAILKKVVPSEVSLTMSHQSQVRNNVKGFPTMARPVTRKSPPREKRSVSLGRSVSMTSPDQVKPLRRRVSQETSHNQTNTETTESQDKIQKQKQLIDRLSAPKTSTSSSARLRNSSSSPSGATKPRPKSAELHRSSSLSTTSSSSTSLKSPISPPPTASSNSNSNAKSPKSSTPGRATGFVRSKSIDPNSSKPKLTRSPSSSTTRPTAVAKPNVKTDRGNVKPDQTKSSSSPPEKTKSSDTKLVKDDDTNSKETPESKESNPSLKNKSNKIEFDPLPEDNIPDLDLPQMSALLLRNSNLSSAEEHSKNLGYYQLNFDFEDD